MVNTFKQKDKKKQWDIPKIEKLDICTFTKAKHGTGAETKKSNGGCYNNTGSYCV